MTVNIRVNVRISFTFPRVIHLLFVLKLSFIIFNQTLLGIHTDMNGRDKYIINIKKVAQKRKARTGHSDPYEGPTQGIKEKYDSMYGDMNDPASWSTNRTGPYKKTDIKRDLYVFFRNYDKINGIDKKPQIATNLFHKVPPSYRSNFETPQEISERKTLSQETVINALMLI